MFDTIVVGGGIIGASAARRLSTEGASVAVIAPPEPTTEDHPGPFAAHHDVSRLSWTHHADEVETELARRSVAAIDGIESLADRTIYSRSGQLFVAEPGLEPDRVAAAEAAVSRGQMERLSAADAMRRFEGLSIRGDAVVMLEPAPSGWFDPRELVAAQLRGTVRNGGQVFLSPAIGIDGTSVSLRDGRVIEAHKVLVAAGAYANTPGLLPRPVAMRLKTETVLMAELDEPEAERLSALPPIIYALEDPHVEDVYMAPPLRYPDGSMLLKWGANTTMDRWVTGRDEIDAWYRHGGAGDAVERMSPSLLRTFPGLAVSRFRTVRCVVAYTGHGLPYVDVIEPGRLYIAVGGNGHSAKWSAGLGDLAASLVLNDRWTDSLPAERFRVQWEGEVDVWAGKDLLADRSRGSAE